MPHGTILEDSGQPTLTWTNVGIGLAFILFDVGISTVFRLGVGLSLLIAALRCIGQLGVVATILHQVFENKNPWLVAFITCAYLPLSSDYLGTQDITVVLNFLGTFEAGRYQPFSTMSSRNLAAISSYQQIPTSLPLHGVGLLVIFGYLTSKLEIVPRSAYRHAGFNDTDLDSRVKVCYVRGTLLDAAPIQ